MAPNPFLLAADNSPALLPLLRENPTLASGQDEHGYSLVHAAASYNHLDLLRALIQEFKVDVNIKDEDGETALFVVETVDAAKCLVEELEADIEVRGSDDVTAREKIDSEGDYPEVTAYLLGVELSRHLANGGSASDLPAAPEGLKVSVGTMADDELPEAVDPEFRRRIEELAEREDFHTPEGQAELRRLVEQAILGDGGLTEERNVRPKQG
ncbi:ankyrin repeat-containing protein [Plectosphaerella plurivora]|uniref:Ankyrin repeat-containing protein n=1 Tax=Plectosphaerella plurivora TaxID=936078 RepID=A0A9P8V1F9_9PEZI|nr:ankyrin repeat-containing protein [Plectosphaerella plurivora]